MDPYYSIFGKGGTGARWCQSMNFMNFLTVQGSSVLCAMTNWPWLSLICYFQFALGCPKRFLSVPSSLLSLKKLRNRGFPIRIPNYRPWGMQSGMPGRVRLGRQDISRFDSLHSLPNDWRFLGTSNIVCTFRTLQILNDHNWCIIMRDKNDKSRGPRWMTVSQLPLLSAFGG